MAIEDLHSHIREINSKAAEDNKKMESTFGVNSVEAMFKKVEKCQKEVDFFEREMRISKRDCQKAEAKLEESKEKLKRHKIKTKHWKKIVGQFINKIQGKFKPILMDHHSKNRTGQISDTVELLDFTNQVRGEDEKSRNASRQTNRRTPVDGIRQITDTVREKHTVVAPLSPSNPRKHRKTTVQPRKSPKVTEISPIGATGITESPEDSYRIESKYITTPKYEGTLALNYQDKTIEQLKCQDKSVETVSAELVFESYHWSCQGMESALPSIYNEPSVEENIIIIDTNIPSPVMTEPTYTPEIAISEIPIPIPAISLNQFSEEEPDLPKIIDEHSSLSQVLHEHSNLPQIIDKYSNLPNIIDEQSSLPQILDEHSNLSQALDKCLREEVSEKRSSFSYLARITAKHLLKIVFNERKEKRRSITKSPTIRNNISSAPQIRTSYMKKRTVNTQKTIKKPEFIGTKELLVSINHRKILQEEIPPENWRRIALRFFVAAEEYFEKIAYLMKLRNLSEEEATRQVLNKKLDGNEKDDITNYLRSKIDMPNYDKEYQEVLSSLNRRDKYDLLYKIWKVPKHTPHGYWKTDFTIESIHRNWIKLLEPLLKRQAENLGNFFGLSKDNMKDIHYLIASNIKFVRPKTAHPVKKSLSTSHRIKASKYTHQAFRTKLSFLSTNKKGLDSRCFSNWIKH